MPRALQLLMRTPEQTLVEMLVFETLLTVPPSAFPALSRDRVVKEPQYRPGCRGSERRERRRQCKMTPDQVRGGQWGGMRVNR
jgi:hypothetical protein